VSTKLRTASWALLTFEAVVLLAFGILSAYVAYGGQSFAVGGTPIEEIAAGDAALEAGMRGVRGTAAAYAVACGVLMLGTAVGPYRGGSVASWWTLLAALAALALVTYLRVPTVGTQGGVAAAAILFGFGTVALLLDVGRLRSGR
jgi:hypothetical protein